MSHHFLHFDDVHYSYAGGSEVLRGVSLRVEHGEKVALLGANGAGKSTLTLLADGLAMPTHGRVVMGGIQLTRRTAPTIRRTVGLVFQNPDDQLFMPTVEEDVAFGPVNMRLTRDEIEERTVRSLEAVGALDLRRSAPQHLSGGQKKSVAIAAVLAMEPSVLVLDEPTSALDPRARRQIVGLIGSFTHTTLIATHDMALALAVCPRTVIMQQGRIVADGDTRAILDDEALLCRCGL